MDPPNLLQRRKDDVKMEPLSPTRKNTGNVMVKQEFKGPTGQKPGSGSEGQENSLIDLTETP